MGRTTTESLVILDNTVLTNFGLVQRPDLVMRLWPGTVCTTQEVVDEYQAGVRVAGLLPEAWEDLPVLDLTPSEIAFSLSLPQRLGAGERACLAVAVNRQTILATDDRDARQYAQRADLTVAGSVGIL
jgi:predicted nucleic acid-binding protein